MHNIKELRKNLEFFNKKFKNRNQDFNLDLFTKLDDLNRKLIADKEKLEHEKKFLPKSKDQSNFDKSKKITEEILIISKKQNEAQNN